MSNNFYTDQNIKTKEQSINVSNNGFLNGKTAKRRKHKKRFSTILFNSLLDSPDKSRDVFSRPAVELKKPKIQSSRSKPHLIERKNCSAEFNPVNYNVKKMVCDKEAGRHDYCIRLGCQPLMTSSPTEANKHIPRMVSCIPSPSEYEDVLSSIVSGKKTPEYSPSDVYDPVSNERSSGYDIWNQNVFDLSQNATDKVNAWINQNNDSGISDNNSFSIAKPNARLIFPHTGAGDQPTSYFDEVLEGNPKSISNQRKRTDRQTTHILVDTPVKFDMSSSRKKPSHGPPVKAKILQQMRDADDSFYYGLGEIKMMLDSLSIRYRSKRDLEYSACFIGDETDKMKKRSMFGSFTTCAQNKTTYSSDSAFVEDNLEVFDELEIIKEKLTELQLSTTIYRPD